MLLHCRVSISVSLLKEFFLFWKTMKHHMSFLLAQMKELKKTSTPTKSPPILGDLTENRGNRRFIRVLVWLSSLCPYGVSHGVFIGWRMENDLNPNYLGMSPDQP
jgi:hypothetical protein